MGNAFSKGFELTLIGGSLGRGVNGPFDGQPSSPMRRCGLSTDVGSGGLLRYRDAV